MLRLRHHRERPVNQALRDAEAHCGEAVRADVIGDPRIALTWLADELSSLGITLQKGQTVTAGLAYHCLR